ncbi:MAG: LON peptidase substrate-binding domain-containing protein [Clostridia bacterium]|nr:LON peptidase substrate-binding domain-containing protein [Clostridia bacterium]
MPSFIEKAEQLTLPVIALNATVPFPAATFNFEANDEAFAAAAKVAADGNALVFLVAFSDLAEEKDPTAAHPYYSVGTVAKIKQMLRTPEGQTRIIAEGLTRATVLRYVDQASYIEAELVCKRIYLPDNGGIRGEAAIHEMIKALENNLQYLPGNTEELMKTARAYRDPGALADFIAANALIRGQDKQAILECFDPLQRAEILLEILQEEIEVLREEALIRRRVNARMNRNQKEYYLREQIKVIQEELGEGGDVEEYYARIEAAALPAEVEVKLRKEADRLAKTPFGSAEATVLSNYLDTCLDIPWGKTTKDRTHFPTVQKVLSFKKRTTSSASSERENSLLKTEHTGFKSENLIFAPFFPAPSISLSKVSTSVTEQTTAVSGRFPPPNGTATKSPFFTSKSPSTRYE